MRDFSSWSLNLGKWYGVHVRLHAFFLLFAVCTLYLMTAKALVLTDDPGQGVLDAMLLGILFLSVLAMKWPTAWRRSASAAAEQIVIWPFGGLAQPHVPHEYQHELITAVAGPLVNLLICMFVVPVVWAYTRTWGLVQPAQPRGLVEGGPWLVLIKLTLWLNWMLVLVNLLPAFPLDGGRVLALDSVALVRLSHGSAGGDWVPSSWPPACASGSVHWGETASLVPSGCAAALGDVLVLQRQAGNGPAGGAGTGRRDVQLRLLARLHQPGPALRIAPARADQSAPPLAGRAAATPGIRSNKSSNRKRNAASTISWPGCTKPA